MPNWMSEKQQIARLQYELQEARVLIERQRIRTVWCLTWFLGIGVAVFVCTWALWPLLCAAALLAGRWHEVDKHG